jgi:hypothetical protein
MKILLGGFSDKVGRDDIYKPRVGNENLHNDYAVRGVNVDTSKNPTFISIMFPQRNIHKYTRTSPDGNTHYHIGYNLIDRRWH